MTISIDTSHYASTIFIALFVALVIATLRRVRTDEFFPLSTTTELKGLAVLGIIFSHIAFYLVDDHAFLFPLTIIAGVCVNLFLFLSGYGLTVVSVRKGETRREFYKNRLLKLMIPFWLVLGVFLLADYFVLGISYGWHTVVPALFGIFTSANLYHDINSPLWYFTWILFYYILFSLFFSRTRAWATALALFVIPTLFLILRPAWFNGVISLYIVHCVAFPLGVFAGWLRTDVRVAESAFFHMIRKWLTIPFIYYGSLLSLLVVIGYTALHAGIGSSATVEQTVSILTMCAFLALFAIKKVESRVLTLVGTFSYELYLLHWPIMYRYDFLYTHIPAWLATYLYITLFLVLGWVLQRASGIIFATIKKQHE